MRSLAKISLVTLLATAAGCFKFKQDFYILPDGSGKTTVTWALNPMMAGMGGEQGEDPTAKFRETEGVVWGEPVESQGEDGWKYTAMTGFFRDINEVKSGDFQNMKFVPDGEGYTLTLQGKEKDGDDDNGMGPDKEEMNPQMEAMVKQMMAGLELAVRFHMPGNITEVSKDVPYFSKIDAKTAGLQVKAEDLDLKQKDEPKFDNVQVKCGAADAETCDALKKEVEAGLLKDGGKNGSEEGTIE